MLLAAEIPGTKTELAVFSPEEAPERPSDGSGGPESNDPGVGGGPQ